MPKKPRNLVFGREERPKLSAIVILALQHSALSILFLVYAVLIAKGAGFTAAEQQALLAGTLISCGIGAIIQAGFPRYASGLLVIPIGTPVFVAFGIEAGRQAGPGGIATLAIIGGLTQIAMGRILPKLRAFFPSEVCGVVVLMLGVSILPHGFLRILGTESTGMAAHVHIEPLVIGLATLVAIIAASVWLKGTARFFALLIGCAVGHAVAAMFGELGHFGAAINAAEFVSAPHLIVPSLNVGMSLIAAFVVLAVVSTIDDMGVFISMDRLDDADWSRPDMAQTSRGVTFAGVNAVIAGILGGSFPGFSSTNIGLAFATGVTSRIVGVAAGVALLAASFFPKLIAAVGAMPAPVVGGILGYAASFFIVAGAELALSRMLSPRRMIVIGLPVAAGIMLQANPELAENSAGIVAAILHSPLIFSALLAIALNAIMRIGIAQSNRIEITEVSSDRHEQINDTLEQWGETWGLPRATVTRAASAANQIVEAVWDLRHGPVMLEARQDDVHVDLRVIYTGQPITFPDRAPTPDELLSGPEGEARMAGWLVRHLANTAKPFQRKGEQGVLLQFDA